MNEEEYKGSTWEMILLRNLRIYDILIKFAT